MGVAYSYVIGALASGVVWKLFVGFMYVRAIVATIHYRDLTDAINARSQEEVRLLGSGSSRYLMIPWRAAALGLVVCACSAGRSQIQVGMVGVLPFPDNSSAMLALKTETDHALSLAMRKQQVTIVPWTFCKRRGQAVNDLEPCKRGPAQPRFLVFAGLALQADSSFRLVVWAWRRDRQGVLFRDD